MTDLHTFSFPLSLPLNMELKSERSSDLKRRDPSGMKQAIQMHLLNIDALFLWE